jgi:tetratricopeptide (TPR) repeat protein
MSLPPSSRHAPPLFSLHNWANETSHIVFTEESANLLCRHPKGQGMPPPQWELQALASGDAVMVSNQRATLGRARLAQNLRHYDRLTEVTNLTRWLLHSVQLLQLGPPETVRTLERLDRYIHSRQSPQLLGSSAAESAGWEQQREHERLLYALSTKAMLLQRTGTDGSLARNSEAVAVLREAIAVAPSRADVACNLAFALAAAGDTAEAIQQYDALLLGAVGGPSSAMDRKAALEGRGWALQLEKRYSEAVATYQASLAAHSERNGEHGIQQPHHPNPRMLVSLGVCLTKLGRVSEALPQFDSAAKLGENSGALNAAKLRRHQKGQLGPAWGP